MMNVLTKRQQKRTVHDYLGLISQVVDIAADNRQVYVVAYQMATWNKKRNMHISVPFSAFLLLMFVNKGYHSIFCRQNVDGIECANISMHNIQRVVTCLLACFISTWTTG